MNTEQELHKAHWFITAAPSVQEDMKHFVAMAVAHTKAEARREVVEEIMAHKFNTFTAKTALMACGSGHALFLRE